jgi:predicted MFS family arabinose efflux permease
MIGPLIGGLMVDFYSINALIWLLLIFFVFAVVILFIISRQKTPSSIVRRALAQR